MQIDWNGNRNSEGVTPIRPPAAAQPSVSAPSITLKVGNTSTDIAVDSNNNTLDGLASYINGHELGVMAGVIHDLNGVRLRAGQCCGQRRTGIFPYGKHNRAAFHQIGCWSECLIYH